MKNTISQSRLVLMSILCCAVLAILGCSACTTKPKLGTLSGSVTLVNDTADNANDPVDHSGATIALYAPATLDTMLVRLNIAYPQAGVMISQETEFDHRDSAPVAITFSNADGSFSLTDIEPGLYNLAVLKEQWGIRYRYNIQIKGGEITPAETIELYPAVQFSSSVQQDVTLKADHTYIVSEDVNFISAVDIEPRAMIFVNPGRMVKFYGEVTTPGLTDLVGFWRFLPASGLYSVTGVSFGFDDYYNSVAFYTNELSLNSGIFRYMGNSLVLSTVHAELNNVIVQHFSAGISLTQGNATLNRLILADGTDYGINMNSTTSAVSRITGSIIRNVYEGVSLNLSGTYIFTNNYVSNTNTGIGARYCTGTITHNSFNQNSKDIVMGGVVITTDIAYNDFFYSKQYCILPGRAAIVNNNNFYRTDGYFIPLWTPNYPPTYSYAMGDLNAENNYWAVTDLDDYLHDANDNYEHPDYPCAFYIDYIPRRNSPVTDAGIQ